jgi:hypothetical protein
MAKGNEVKVGLGSVHPKDTLFMRHDVGTAKGTGGEYELSAGLNYAPIVTCKSTGKTFAFSWAKLIEHAVEVGRIHE